MDTDHIVIEMPFITYTMENNSNTNQCSQNAFGEYDKIKMVFKNFFDYFNMRIESASIYDDLAFIV